MWHANLFCCNYKLVSICGMQIFYLFLYSCKNTFVKESNDIYGKKYLYIETANLQSKRKTSTNMWHLHRHNIRNIVAMFFLANLTWLKVVCHMHPHFSFLISLFLPLFLCVNAWFLFFIYNKFSSVASSYDGLFMLY